MERPLDASEIVRIEKVISSCWLGERGWDGEVSSAVERTLDLLETGDLRVVERAERSTAKGTDSPEEEGAGYCVLGWVKEAILLYFRHTANREMLVGEPGAGLSFWDKVPVRHWSADEGVRVVPPAVVRRGAYVSPGAILMPSYVNIGAHVGAGSLIDTWATVGSCAQVGQGVHIAGGVGLGGVLEPPQAMPVVIEDEAFIGSRAIIVEGARIGRGAVIGANVVITASTHIIDVTGPEPREYRGVVPPYSVVIPGVRPRRWPAGEYGVPCALIIGRRSEATDQKTSLNDALRQFDVPV